VKRWSAIINHSRTSGKPPQTAEFDWHGDLQRYLAPESEAVQITIYKSVRIPMSNRAGPPGRRPSGGVENARGRVPFLTIGRLLRRTHMGLKSLLPTLVCAPALSAPVVANANGTPMDGHAVPTARHSAGSPGVWSGNPGWHRGMGHFDHGSWRSGHWWHGIRGSRPGWWWNAGPNWYWYPAAVYPYPDLYTPPYLASGFWYWCDFYQNYYPNVGVCPSGWQAVEPE